MNYTFGFCTNFSNFRTENSKGMSNKFQGYISLTSFDMSNFDTSYIEYMFFYLKDVLQ